jgi:anti-sigma factor RsiW
MHPTETAINDYVDESLDPRERPAIEQHLGACRSCRQLVEDLREIRRAAATLDLREPPARVWPRLERAIRLEPEVRPATRSPRRQLVVWASWLAVAAALTLATVVGLRFSPFGSRSATDNAAPGAQTGATGTIATGDAAQSIEMELRQAEQHYEKAITGLEQIADADQGALDPRTAATLRKNLAVIDQAISESRAAVRSQPASGPAQESLIEGFKTKIGLLQDTVALINEMRKGNEAGAARIVSGLKRKGT